MAAPSHPDVAPHGSGVPARGRPGDAGAALAVAVLAALVAAVPAFLRGTATPGVWLTLAGSTVLVLGPLLVGLVHARPLPVALYATLCGVGISAVPLALLAAKLKEATHHRGLGSVTFAVLAAVVMLTIIAVVLRLLTWTNQGQRSSGRAKVRLCVGLIALLGPALLIGSAFSAPAARSSALDVLLALGCAALIGSAPWPESLFKVASRGGLPVWVALVGAAVLFAVTGAGGAANAASPALFAPLSWFLR